MPEITLWFCDECQKTFSDMTVRPFAVCGECKSRSFKQVKAVIENPVESKPETVVS